ncbi:putative mitochondrial pyruvate carrier [Helianthus debilis subsp. tardiflorus]
MSFFRTFLNSPVGPKTTHFWGPVANWGFVAAVCMFACLPFHYTIYLFSNFIFW